MPSSSPNSVAFISLGCPKNLVDSEHMLADLAQAGLKIVSSDQPAHAVVINTCGFLEASREESLAVISDAIDRKTRGDINRVIVAGCLVQRHRAKLLSWAPGIDAMIGVFDRDRIVDAVQGTSPSRTSLDTEGPTYWIAGNALQAAEARGRNTVGLTVQGADGKGIGYWENDADRFRLTPRHWAYLRISEGCNQKCAFCTIPSIRGKMRSKPLDAILDEAQRLLDDGCVELNLIGQDTTSWGFDIGDDRGLEGLLRALNALLEAHGPGTHARLMYAYPSKFTDDMIDAIAQSDRILNYIDMPLQHASDAMLTAMRRNVSAQHQLDLVMKLRERVPGMALRSTFITGFPGETDADHRELLAFVNDVQFDALGVFQYSKEAGTPAARLEDDPNLAVSAEMKAAREEEIMLLQQEIAFENAAFLAEEQVQFDVLIDGDAPETSEIALRETDPAIRANRQLHLSSGRCYHQAPQVDSQTCVASTEPLAPGELVRCTIVGSDGYDLIGRPTAELQPSTSLPVIG